MSNPYDYMRNADIVVLPSRFEGKAVSIEEAKLLKKSIVTTNFSTAKNQIEDGINGLIIKMNYLDLAEGIEKLIINKELKKKFEENLEKDSAGNRYEIEKLYKLIEE